MPVFRVNKTKDYTVMSNYHFRETKMSLKAIGMLSMMLSLPDDWEYSVEGLTKIRCESKNTINTILNELEDFGYLKRTKQRNDKGIYKNCIYDIYEQPYLKNPDMENPYLDYPYMENESQLNTNILNTKLINNTPPNKETIFEYVEKNFMRTLSPIEYEKIKNWEDDELTRYAITKAVLNQKYNINYIDKILYAWKKNNVTTVQQAQADDENFINSKTKKQNTYKEPEWFNKQNKVEIMTEKEQEEIDDILKEIG